ncbi:MAG: site-2 protease family protein [Candidatus Binatus sp.]|uniref:site-2 protease family protein n=1 Tax=Candidatus Binatus sp. TaxID=2811406 RepID=UPI003C710F05
MDEIITHKDTPTVLTEIPRYSAPPEPGARALDRPRIPPLNVALLLLTFLTTTTAGAYMNGEDVSYLHPFLAIVALGSGLSFSIPLMMILLAHEMGHYLTSRYHNVDASLPYFIPAPPSLFIIGTFGAFIRMREPARTRRVMFDIGAAGPWAGVMLAIPAVIIGLYLSDVTPLDKTAGGLELGNSLLFLGLSHLVLGVDPSTVNVNLHPIAFAGWLGLFVTTLNLLPVGQLDGGHVVYALFPRRHRTISVLFVISCVLMVLVPLALGYNLWWGWLLWAVLVLALGLGHPSTIDRDTPLNPRRALAAWATVALFIVTFSPVPLAFVQPEAPIPTDENSHSQEIIHHMPHYDQMLRQLGRVKI